MMMAARIVDEKWSGKTMEGGEGLRTVECLRGRLLAERAASRAAKEESEQMGTKLTELENQLREETKARDRAEKRLKLFLKKLESMNIPYVSEDSDQSSLLEKSDLSSVSSTASSSGAKEPEAKVPQTQINDPPKCESTASQELEDNASQTASSNQGHCCPVEEPLTSPERANSQEANSELDSSRGCDNLKPDNRHSSTSSSSSVERGDTDGGNNDEGNGEEAEDECIDNSMALVAVDLAKASSKPTDPVILDANVKEALEALRHAREMLQCSMERRDATRVGVMKCREHV
ncbi:uncharacterized protein LOC127787993 [Diospyros lotus]|uniref:uncharacterized protein LOC127787993 n=1 Tax=Diospyros lotus TaxID=55363 RepID=UPI002256AEC0|nr:uncharacterized protein LOC127787993 [Diospyros lotus]